MGYISAGGAHAMSYFTKEKEKNNSFPSSLTGQEQLRCHFQIISNIPSSFQLFIPPETISSGTVHVADLCITAQRLLAVTRMYGKWENVMENP